MPKIITPTMETRTRFPSYAGLQDILRTTEAHGERISSVTANDLLRVLNAAMAVVLNDNYDSRGEAVSQLEGLLR